MSAVDTTVAKRYAKALFEVARENDTVARTEEELKTVIALVRETPDLEKFLQHPNIAIESKVSLLQQALQGKISEAVFNTLRLLLERRREAILGALADEFVKIANQALGQANAVVTAAFPLTAEEEAEIAAQFGRLTGKKIRIESLVDRNLLGGIQVRIGDRLYDGSLAGKLNRLEKSLQQNQAL